MSRRATVAIPSMVVPELCRLVAHAPEGPLEGKIQERYGYEKDQTKKAVDDWYNVQSWPG